jgi:hypothetical protein
MFSSKKTFPSWSKELNLISWNGAEPKYDLRNWTIGHEKMGNGITLTKGEVQKLIVHLSEIKD